MNVKELRTLVDEALRHEGLEQRQLFPRGPMVWSLPADDVIRFFWPHAYRRPWGFIYSGGLGVEIPSLRKWLSEHKPNGEVGIFHSSFVTYLIANEDVLCDFMVEHGQPIPADLWAGLIKDRLERVPRTLAELISIYGRDRERLGWLAHPNEAHAWDFLLRWHADPNPSMHVPKMLPNGRIV